MAKEKTTGCYFKMSQEESELFEQRMALSGIRNKSAFIRKMCIDGHVFNLDLTMLNEIKRLLGITANNVNQIARRLNRAPAKSETSWGEDEQRNGADARACKGGAECSLQGRGGEAYRNDIAEVNEQLTEIRSDFGKLLTLLSEVASAKPGKRFIPPPKITDFTDENPAQRFEEERTSNVTERMSAHSGDAAERSL